MLHKPAEPGEKDLAAAYKSRLGIWMFLFYSLFYAGFVVINLTNPLWMEINVFLGMNLATVYGFVLIIAAFILALVYDWFCRRKEQQLNSIQANKEKEH